MHIYCHNFVEIVKPSVEVSPDVIAPPRAADH